MNPLIAIGIDVTIVASIASIITEVIQLFSWFQVSDIRKRALAVIAGIIAALYVASQNGLLHFTDWKALIALIVAITIGSYGFYKAIIKLVLPKS